MELAHPPACFRTSMLQSTAGDGQQEYLLISQ